MLENLKDTLIEVMGPRQRARSRTEQAVKFVDFDKRINEQ